MSSDLKAITGRAMLIRDVTRDSAERAAAMAHASDDLLKLVREVEQLRAAASPDAGRLAHELAAVRLVPVQEGPLSDLVDVAAGRLAKWAADNAPCRGRLKDQTWDTSAVFEVFNLLKQIDAFIQERIKKQ